MLKNSKKLYTYNFEGYWRDIGTIDSIWETNMDIIRPESGLDLFNDKWKIYTSSTYSPPQFIGGSAKIDNSLISEGCVIKGTVKNSIIFISLSLDFNFYKPSKTR